MNKANLKTTHVSVLIVMGLLCVLTIPAFGATYYVRKDGGNPNQCTGLADAPYPGSGSNKSCAFSHPSWVQAPQGNSPTILKGGDTLIIDGSNNAEYMIGYGAPNSINTNECNQNWPYNCYWRPIPSGPDPAHPTRILGKGWDTGCDNPPQLWGTERAKYIVNMSGSDNVEIQCLEITDHSDCQERGPNPCNRKTYPHGDWATTGIRASDSENVLLKNINIHGLAHKGVHAGRLKDWTIEDSRIYANSFVGWDGDISENNSSNSGTITFNKVEIQYSGCGQRLDGTPYNCYGQSQSGYGDGLATATTGGHWVFNEVDFSHNVQDGLDLLYLNSSGSAVIKRSRFEGNGGNQAKISGDAIVENSLFIGNCNYFQGSPMAVKSGKVSACRALGNTLVFAYHPGMVAEFYNSTLIGYGDVIVQTSKRSGCNGTERLISKNNIFLGARQFGHSDTTDLYYAAGGDLCANIKMEDDYSVIWATKNIKVACNGKEHSMCEDPKFNQTVDKWYTGDAYDVSLKSTSPAIGKGLVLTGKSGLDYASNERGNVWDIGALEYDTGAEEPTCAQDVAFCLTEGDCVAQGYYWYNDACHTDPEPLPVCGDDVQYCTNSAACSAQGYYWYNNICNLVPEPEPNCVDGVQYCKTSTECAAFGHYWYNSTCNALPQSQSQPQSQPTCADGIQYCTNSAVCQSHNHYWYNNACHAEPQPPVEEPEACVPTWCDLPLIECGQPPLTGGTDSCGNPCTKPSIEWPNCIEPEPEPEPTCADGIQYCSGSAECQTNGYHWYNNVCHVEPEPQPTCKDGIQYCTVPSDCVDNGHYWYAGTCHLEPEPLPTCADGIQYCTKSSDCQNEGYHWYDNTCHIAPKPQPTCADGIQYCTKNSDCTKEGYHWYDNACHADPEPLPTCADGIQYCTKKSDCTKEGYHWYDNTCHIEPEPLPTCADGVQYCLTSTDCIIEGHFWYDNACHVQPKPLPTCADGIQYCTKRSDCTKEGYHWYNNTCHTEPEPLPTCADGIQYCLTLTDCEGQNYFWYDNGCHTDPKPVPQVQKQDIVDTTQLASNVPEEPEKPEEKSSKEDDKKEVDKSSKDDQPLASDETPDKEKSTGNEKPSDDKDKEKKSKSTVINSDEVDKKSSPVAGGLSGGGSGGGFAGIGGGSGRSSSRGAEASSKGKTGESSNGNQGGGSAGKGVSGNIPSQSSISSGVTVSPAPAPKKDVLQESDDKGKAIPTFIIREAKDTTEISEIKESEEEETEQEKETAPDAEGEAATELQNVFLSPQAKSETGAEGDPAGQDAGTQAEGKSVLEGIKDGVQQIWHNVLNWFSGFGA